MEKVFTAGVKTLKEKSKIRKQAIRLVLWFWVFSLYEM